METIVAKRCTKCKECKPMEAFSADPRLSDGKMSRCKACRTDAWMNSEFRAKRQAKASPRRVQPWTATEIHLLTQLYETQGVAACKAVMPNRTRAAIIQYAGKMGLAASPEVQPVYAVPAHDYTAEDHALRAWRYPVERGQLRAAA